MSACEHFLVRMFPYFGVPRLTTAPPLSEAPDALFEGLYMRKLAAIITATCGTFGGITAKRASG